MENWMDALSALRDRLPQGEVAEEADKETGNDDNGKNSVQSSPLIVTTDKKGRHGKVATIIEGFTIGQERVEEIARKIKQQLGVGGSVREGEILIQGDYKEKVKTILKGLNFKTKG